MAAYKYCVTIVKRTCFRVKDKGGEELRSSPNIEKDKLTILYILYNLFFFSNTLICAYTDLQFGLAQLCTNSLFNPDKAQLQHNPQAHAHTQTHNTTIEIPLGVTRLVHGRYTGREEYPV